MGPLLLCLRQDLPAGWRDEAWSLADASVGAVVLAPSEVEDLAAFARRLDEHAPRAVVFGGSGLDAQLLYCSLRGVPTMLLADEASLVDPANEPWSREGLTALFHADRVVAIGQGAERHLDTGEGATLEVHKLPAFSSREQLAGLVELAAGIESRTASLPEGRSTRERLLDHVQLHEALVSTDRRRELHLVREAAEAWARRDGAEEVRPARPERTRPRFLFISHNFTKTGAPMALYWALRALKDRGVTADLDVLGVGDGPMAEMFARVVGEDRVTVADLANDGPPWTPVLDAIDAIQPDVVFLNGSPAYPLVPLLTWKGYPTLWWYHEGLNIAKRDGHLFTRRSLEGMVRYCLGLPASLMTASMDTVQQLEAFCPAARGRTHHVPYGFEVSRLVAEGDSLRARRAEIRAELGIGPDDLFLVCVGSLERRKNQKRLALAFQAFLDHLPEDERSRCHLVSIGNLDPDGAAPDNFHAECVKAVRPEYEGQIRFLGPKPSAFSYVAAADAQVLVSTNECSPLVNLESILLGTIVISSRVHGIPEVVADGERGYLVEPEDEGDILATLERFHGDWKLRPEVLDRMRIAALDHVAAWHDVSYMGSLVHRELDNLLHLSALTGAPTPLGPAVNAYLGQQLDLRWSLVKHDVANERNFALAHCHHLYRSEGELEAST